ncbi:MAG: leucine-rich repeat domain-containing protein [Bacteroidales bacterium]|nr:leucine-rich repeat domain-containing protein [Bacteroidales bacterium]
MKVVKVLIACVLCVVFGEASTWAQYDFCQPAPSGQMLYYQVLPVQPTRLLIQIVPTVKVTHPWKEWPYYAGNKPVGDLVIPEKVTFEGVEYDVSEIGENAFYRCDSLSSVTAPLVGRVGTQAFCGCTGLKNIMLGVKYVGREGAYVYCFEIGEGAFAYCRSIEWLTLSADVRKIGISAFSMCGGLKKVSMTAEVERLCDAMTFFGCPLMQDRKNRKKESGEPSGTVVWSR